MPNSPVTEQFIPGPRLIDGGQLNALVGQTNQGFNPGPPGNIYYVDTTSGSNSDSGKTWNGAFLTMAKALDTLSNQNAKLAGSANNSTIYFIGKIREQLVAPLGVSGIRIIGAAIGQVRDDNGAKWYAPASPVAGQALIEIREQGWSFYNFLMSPDTTGGACIKAHRAEDATYPDSSHFIASGMRFVGTGGTPIGIEDIGGNSNYLVDDCSFQSLTRAITCTSTGVAVPLRNRIQNSRFMLNTNDITSSYSYSIISGNQFMTAGSGATNKVISTTYNSVQGGNNHITLNVFSNTEAQIAPASGYTGAASDLWSNYVNDQAALAVGQPA